ncbi:MAG: PIG-L family deacetylase [Planctomycetes bacterium]|nr:PIG-L family deacetylase [Planctomycetota bacterium]
MPGEHVDLIAVGAHPDDVEIGCGGTLARLVKLGYRVGIVDLTDGEPTPHSPGPEVRLAEARRAAEILGVHARETLPFPNRRLFDCFEARVALAKLFRRYRPHVVLGLTGKTVLASPDHYQAMLIIEAAVFYSRLTKWDEHFDGLPAHSVSSQIGFSLAIRSFEQPAGAGYFVADISDTLETKLAAIRAYQTQFPPAKEGVLRLIEAVSRHYGQMAGFEAGELFYSTRPIGTDDLLRMACPGHAQKKG